MPPKTCKVLLIEDNLQNTELIHQLLRQTDGCSLADGLSFEVKCVLTLQQGITGLTQEDFQVILLSLNLEDQEGLHNLKTIREKIGRIPVLVHTNQEDETLFVKSFQLGADGYLTLHKLETNLLLYEIRLAIERQQYITQIENLEGRKRQEQEVADLEQLVNNDATSITSRMFGVQPLRDSVPEIFQEMKEDYSKILDLALEQRAFKVEHDISEKLRDLADKLGFLKASPRDIIDLHTKTLREKTQNVTLAKAQAYVTEGRLMVLELMGNLVTFYRKYFIGLSNINLRTPRKSDLS
jgi:DNA-binding NarL/FixJ family response regulator